MLSGISILADIIYILADIYLLFADISVEISDIFIPDDAAYDKNILCLRFSCRTFLRK